jgi:hypothetical protein
MGFRYHDLTFNPVGLWQLDGNILDTSGNANNLSVSTGTEQYIDVAPGLLGFNFNNSTILTDGTPGSELQITGDLTIECLIQIESIPSTGDSIVGLGGSTDAEADNFLYLFRFPSANQSPGLFSESGAGVNDEEEATTLRLLLGHTYHLAMTRISDVPRFYINGELIHTSAAMTTPTGGTSSPFWIGGHNGVNALHAALASIKIIDRGRPRAVRRRGDEGGHVHRVRRAVSDV